MPIPKPRKGETEDKFIGRCMGNDTIKSDYPENKQRLAVCYGSWRKVHGGKKPPKKTEREKKVLTMKLGKLCKVLRKIRRQERLKDEITNILEIEISNKSWAKVNKSKLPASCFLWVEDMKKKTTWHLPYREGVGGINPKTGMYKSAGSINAGAVRAIMAALAGARTGKAMTVPASVRKKAEALAKRLKIGLRSALPL